MNGETNEPKNANKADDTDDVDNTLWKKYFGTIEQAMKNNENKYTYLNKFFQNDSCTASVQIIIALVWGILLSPWSAGLIMLAASIVIYEIMIYIFTKGNPKYYNVFLRTSAICSSVLGFIIGRTLSGDNVCNPGI